MGKIVRRRPKQRKLGPGELDCLIADYLKAGETIKRCEPGEKNEQPLLLGSGAFVSGAFVMSPL